VRAREHRRKARANPATKRAIVAVRTIERALSEGPASALEDAMQDVRTTLAAAVVATGVVLPTAVGTSATTPAGGSGGAGRRPARRPDRAAAFAKPAAAKLRIAGVRARPRG
jgi:hypothetical protein